MQTLAKIQVAAIFLEQDIRRIYRDLYGDAMLVPTRMMGTNMAAGSFIEFCYKSVNLSLEELKNIKIIHFLIHKLFR